MRTLHFVRVCLLSAAVFALAHAAAAGTVHNYYVAADEVDWNYTPLGMDRMMGTPYSAAAKLFTEAGPHRIGSIYRKAIYREYTDDTFTHLKPRAPEWSISACWVQCCALKLEIPSA
jgi:hephaestin